MRASRGEIKIEEILKDMLTKEEIKSLILEFDEGKTEEARFAYHCDKLECDIQCKLYDEEKSIINDSCPGTYDTIECHGRSNSQAQMGG